MGDQREEGGLRGRTQLACFWTHVFQIPFKKKKTILVQMEMLKLQHYSIR